MCPGYLALWQWMMSPPLTILKKIREVVAVIKDNTAHVTHMITWVRSHGEMALLYLGISFILSVSGGSGFSRNSIGVSPTVYAPTVTFGFA